MLSFEISRQRPRDNYMKTKEQLINNIIGQMKGIQNMMASDLDCFDILVQLKAAKSALNNMICKYIEEELGECSSRKGPQSQKDKIKKLLIELTKNN